MHNHSLTNVEVLAQLNTMVYGHAEVKKTLINLVYASKLRYYQKWGLQKQPSELHPNKNCLIIGKSGTGKTHLVECLKEIIDFPLVVIDATSLVPAGFAGGVTPTMLAEMIILNAIELKKKNSSYLTIEGTCDQTIVFIDEIDKLAMPHESTGNSHKFTQSSILRFIENKYTHYDDGNKKGTKLPNIALNSLSFIFAGAFPELTCKKEKTNQPGFYTNAYKEKEKDYDDLINKYGLMSEFVGRIQHICALDQMTAQDYKDLLCNKIIKEHNDRLRNNNMRELVLNESDVMEIVDKAYNSEQGVRVLFREVAQRSIELEFYCEYDNEENYYEYLA